jgi:hypothetical protein
MQQRYSQLGLLHDTLSTAVVITNPDIHVTPLSIGVTGTQGKEGGQ